MLPGISVERAPPLTVPLRFLLTAPWFACCAGLLLAWIGPDGFASRWQPATLALTHLLTLGFMGQAMFGALLQLLPVVAGVPVPFSALVAAIAYPGLFAGTVALVSGFLLGWPVMFRVAVIALALGIGFYIAMAMWGFLRSRPADASARTIGLAIVGLGVTAGLGVALGSGFGWNLPLPLMALANTHAAWGLLGWAMLLMLGAALVLVPMFQMTPAFPGWVRRGMGAGLFIALTAWSAARALDAMAPAAVLEWILAALIAGVALIVLTLQQRGRRRNHPDATFLLWRTGMLSLLAAVAVWAFAARGGYEAKPEYPLVLGVLLIPGFAMCIIIGMLYRIVPFLLWLYLQLRVGGRPPNVKRILPDEWTMAQVWLHRAALLVLLAAALGIDWLTRPAGALLAVSAGLLGVNLVRASLFAGRFLRSSPTLPSNGGRTRWKSLS